MENSQEINKDIKQRSSKILKPTDLMEMVSHLKLDNKYDEKDVNHIFGEIDSKSEGEIQFNDFIQFLVEKSQKDHSGKYFDFYLSAINFYLTPSEQIIETLKKAISKLYLYEGESKIGKELKWVIRTLSENDLFDFRLKNQYINKDELERTDFLKFLSEYSTDQFKRQKGQDLESLNTLNLKKKQIKDSRRSSHSSVSEDREISTNVAYFYGLSSSLSLISLEALKQIDDFSFNIFKFEEEIGKEFVLPAIGNYIFTSHDLNDTICFKNFDMFLTRTRLGYRKNPYHNDLHAADVLQTCMNIFKIGNITENCELSKLDLSAIFVACLLHDIGHPGLNNNYQINKMTKLALRYNDKSILENFHCYEGFKIIKMADSNILEGFEKEEARIFRRRIIECILSTDMSNHTKVYSTLKCRIDSTYLETDLSQNKLRTLVKAEDNISKFEKQQDLVNFIVHTADISNPAKQYGVYSKWTELLLEEFFSQGDLEKKEGLAVSFLCDRDTVNVPRSQVGFINSIVLPLFKILSLVVPEAKSFEVNLDNNCEFMKKQIENEKNK